ncbi:hypothetical protein NLJ89_g5497 [Agrocybe chaxingu]|uniref:ADP-ribose 1''-phosphate phosphatase n=1 Tax=Agrocybe chaxingu TaxID=84603 RepID=A0A9W8K0G9_9AGAR|nr:hypothetical protein NLJ89_g5497 [Agrocybe chaxingu]
MDPDRSLLLPRSISQRQLSSAYSIHAMSKLTYVKGDLFAAPAGSILVQACNTQGSWGAGIAVAFKDKYPAAFQQYKAHCETHGQALVGTCLLIPGETHVVACLFTSRAYGRRKDAPADILAATQTAVQDLIDQNVDGKPLHAWCVAVSSSTA